MEINYPSPLVTKLESQLHRPDRDAGAGCSGVGPSTARWRVQEVKSIRRQNCWGLNFNP